MSKTNYPALAASLKALLGLGVEPVAIAFSGAADAKRFPAG